MKKVIDIYGESSGSTSEASISLTVNGETGKSYYTIPQGWKLKIYEVDAWGKGETLFRVRVGTDTATLTNNPARIGFNLASKGQLMRTFRMPLIIEATSSDLYVFVTLIQPSAVDAGIELHGELERLA